MILSVTVFAAQPRWKNVSTYAMSISPDKDCYSISIIGNQGTTKIDCTLTLYEKTWYGTYKELSHIAETYYGQSNTFYGYCDISAEKTYKLVAEFTVTCNGVAEDVSGSIER